MTTAMIAKPDGGRIVAVVGSWIRLDGSGSAGKTTIWEIADEPANGDGQLRMSDSQFPLFMASVPGSYVIRLTVTESEDDSATSTAEIFVHDLEPIIQIPQARPGQVTLSEYEVYRGEGFDLDGSASQGPEELRYIWRLEGDAPQATITPGGKTARVYALGSNDFVVALDLAVLGLDESGASVSIPAPEPASLNVRVLPLPDDPVDGPELAPDEEDHWNEHRRDALRSSLKDARGSAEKWQAAIATALTLIGTIAFITGPKEVAKIEEPWVRFVALILLVAAVVVALAAWLTLQFAQDATPEFGPSSSTFEYRSSYIQSAENTVGDIRDARRLVTAAVGLFVAGTLLVVAAAGFDSPAPEAGTSGQSALVVQADGSLTCGVLHTEGNSVRIGNLPVSDVKSLALVDVCPTTTTTTTGAASESTTTAGDG